MKQDCLKNLNEEERENKSNKKKYTVWLNPDMVCRCDVLSKNDNCKSRSEFVEKALRFYIGYLSSEDITTFLSKTLVSVIEGIIRNETNRIASLQFKLAVEAAMMMNVLATEINISKADLRALRGRCIKEVKSTNGRFSFDDAIEFQNSYREDDDENNDRDHGNTSED